MSALTIRKLDTGVKARLRMRAARNQRSMEEEARIILAEALPEPPILNSGEHLIKVFREAFGPLGGVDLELPSREDDWEPPSFER